ncbi:hypothetical protein [Bradyrhizobium sp. AUGA SZCCT0431]|uniref:hypothetical protein n=1 Tax=Bradyrhizobium sp. AUGA SZCCT0431 TaxID=2807674 RepID=UPI001BAD1E0E|nr:hypothetical protein [Bradyrhizobium sp. AUGA SZCCT0431]MBR1142628.1 hypothetical protein [Bradyrhizobium sp. AUGA SZCCT0431]
MSRWVAHTNFWTLETGTLIWLIGGTTSSYPSTGVDLPILLIDGALVMSTVVNASPSEIVIELCGYRRRMTPAVPGSSGTTSNFPGSEWILGERVRESSPVF